MIAATHLGIAGLEVALGINLPGQLKISSQRLCVVVGVDEVAASVVGRIDVDGFDATEVGLIEEFEDLKVIALDEEILGGVEMKGVLAARL